MYNNYQRYFIQPNQINDQFITITGDDIHHMLNVMRMQTGDIALFVVENGPTYEGILQTISKSEATFAIQETFLENNELPVQVTIAQGFVRREKEEEIVEKLVQLGAFAYTSVIMEYCNVKCFPETFAKRTGRFDKIIKEASEQSRRQHLMHFSNPISLKELINNKNEYELCLFAYEKSTSDQSFKNVLASFKGQSLLVVIGPEGGFSPSEVELLRKAGFLPISLGKRILRTELAATYVMSAIGYEIEQGDRNAF